MVPCGVALQNGMVPCSVALNNAVPEEGKRSSKPYTFHVAGGVAVLQSSAPSELPHKVRLMSRRLLYPYPVQGLHWSTTLP
eukprot:358674-Chlamydomonas_euryale.AAC.7